MRFSKESFDEVEDGLHSGFGQFVSFAYLVDVRTKKRHRTASREGREHFELFADEEVDVEGTRKVAARERGREWRRLRTQQRCGGAPVSPTRAAAGRGRHLDD